MRLTVVWLAVALLGCGNAGKSTSAGSQEANYIADRFDADCRSTPAPNAKLAKELDQLCSCTLDNSPHEVLEASRVVMVELELRRGRSAQCHETNGHRVSSSRK